MRLGLGFDGMTCTARQLQLRYIIVMYLQYLFDILNKSALFCVISYTSTMTYLVYSKSCKNVALDTRYPFSRALYKDLMCSFVIATKNYIRACIFEYSGKCRHDNTTFVCRAFARQKWNEQKQCMWRYLDYSLTNQYPILTYVLKHYMNHISARRWDTKI